jgi:hypothetical protein
MGIYHCGNVEFFSNFLNKIIFETDNEAVTAFVYSSELYKKVRIAQQKGY